MFIKSACVLWALMFCFKMLGRRGGWGERGDFENMISNTILTFPFDLHLLIKSIYF